MKLLGFYLSRKVKYNPVSKEIVKEFNKMRTVEQRKYLCHAPFKSMTFFHTGDVLACWYNKLFPLGRYPDDPVKDIWFSSRARKLREHILHNDLSYGCTDCRKTINNKDFFSTGAWRYDFLPDSDSEFPVSMDFQISDSCNLQCVMCCGEYSARVRERREEKELYRNPYDDDFYDQIRPFIPHLKEASFSGGEPFFASEFFRIYDLIKEINPLIRISVSTNGNLLTEKIKDYLQSMPFNICVSLDAITDDTYSRVRVNGNLQKVLSNMKFFSEYAKEKGTTFAVKFCPIRQNWHELPELATYLNERNYSFLHNTVFYPPYCALWNLPSEKLKEIASHFSKLKLKEDTYVQKQNMLRFNELIRQIEQWQKESLKREQENFDDLSVSQLSQIFLKNVENYIDRELSFLDKNSTVYMQHVHDLVKKLITDSPSDKIALAGMRFYASAPVERWLSEINIRDYEKNLDRFLQIGMMQEQLA